MRIGVLTLPLHTNYGGILQAFALQTVMKRMGHDVQIITLPLPNNINTFQRCIRILSSIVKLRLFKYLKWEKEQKETIEIQKFTSLFIAKYIKVRFICNYNDISEGEYDAIIVGSDQVWRKKYFALYGFQIEDAFLRFAEGWRIKRISYAASFGKDDIFEYNKDEISICKSLLKSFDLVSVRESSGISLCKNYFDTEAKCMIDPTLLLEREDYDNLISLYGLNNTTERNSLFYYILDDKKDILCAIESISERINLIPFKVNGTRNVHAPLQDRVQKPVEEWLASFKDSKAIITDSFHACIFSILYNKPFLVFGNKERGLSRFVSLLDLFDLSDRIVFTSEEAHKKIHYLAINPNCNKQLCKYKKLAIEYLSNI